MMLLFSEVSQLNIVPERDLWAAIVSRIAWKSSLTDPDEWSRRPASEGTKHMCYSIAIYLTLPLARLSSSGSSMINICLISCSRDSRPGFAGTVSLRAYSRG
jgi:hypothetical protein